MAQVRASVYQAIIENDLNNVVFQDPFQDEARKAKRNLVAASFAAILIASLDLRMNGFLGLHAATDQGIGGSITQGLAFLTVAYFLAAFMLSAYVDYSAWKFRRERLLTTPYLELIQLATNHYDTTAGQIRGAMEQFDNVNHENLGQFEVNFKTAMSSAQGQLQSISKSMTALYEEMKPLLSAWEVTILKAQRLSWRLRARFLSLWILDITVPLLLAGLALWETRLGVCAVIEKILTH